MMRFAISGRSVSNAARASESAMAASVRREVRRRRGPVICPAPGGNRCAASMCANPCGPSARNRREFDTTMVRRAALCLIVAACGNEAASVPPDASEAAAVAPTPDAAATCGIRTGMRGKTYRSVRAAGLDRTYIVYLPADVDPRTPIPLVFVHHGYTMSAEEMFQITGYAALADREHIAVAFPDGQAGPNAFGAPWNVGTNVCPSTGGPPPSASGDDFAMLDAIKADINADQCIDDDHVF